MKFKVVRGIHNEAGKTYRRDDIVDSASDLAKHNTRGCIKFEAVQGGEIVSSDAVEQVQESTDPEQAAFENMSRAELNSYAEQNDIDVTSLRSKASIIKKLSETPS